LLHNFFIETSENFVAFHSLKYRDGQTEAVTGDRNLAALARNQVFSEPHSTLFPLADQPGIEIKP
jgi:hypothetical protein